MRKLKLYPHLNQLLKKGLLNMSQSENEVVGNRWLAKCVTSVTWMNA